MIKYFNELEDRENQYLQLIEENRFKNRNINITVLPLEFYQKYKNLFLILLDLDVLYTKTLDNSEQQVFLNDVFDGGYDFDYFYYTYINDNDDISDYLTTKGKNRIDFLVRLFNNNYQDLDDLHQYISAIIDLFFINRSQEIYWDKYRVKTYLSSTMVVAKYQNRLPKDVEELGQQALSEIKNYQVEIPEKPHKSVKLNLPNCWYITPNKDLYNSMGTDGHKEANLVYPFYYNILRDSLIPNPLAYLKSTQKLKKKGFITSAEYDEYLNLKYDFPCIYPDSYYNLDSLNKFFYRQTKKKSYNPRLVNLIIGIESAHAGIYDFFYRLRKYSNNYEEDLSLLKELDFNDMLVRCCGFHKVSSLPDKIITTSLINYEEEFREYLERGWTIDFLPPIIINEKKGILEEYPQEFLTIRKILKK